MGTNLQRNSDLTGFPEESDLKGFSKEPIQTFSSHWEVSHPFHLASDQTPEKPELNRTSWGEGLSSGPHLETVGRPHKPCCWQVSKSSRPSKAVRLVISIHTPPPNLRAGPQCHRGVRCCCMKGRETTQ